MDREELLERFKKFCKGLSKQDNIAIIHHSDADGFCSALVTAKAIEKLVGKMPVFLQPYEYGNVEQATKAVSQMREKKVNTIIVLDIGIDSAPHQLGDKADFEKCLIIDHHKMYKDLNDDKIVFLKSQFFTEKDPSSYVTSKFAFDLFSHVADVSEFDWIACLGILGDMNLKNWQEFVQDTLKKRKLSLTLLYKLLDLIASVEVLDSSKMPELFKLFYKTRNLEELLESPFKEHLLKFKNEKDSQIRGFNERAEQFPEIELYFYAINSKLENIKSYVINELSELHPNKTIILMQDLGKDRIRFSARRLDFKVKVNDLLVEAIEGIENSTAGGHVPAAAGSIPKKDLEKFKKNVVEILKNKKNQ